MPLQAGTHGNPNAIEHNIRINAIGVGGVVTNLLNHFMEDGPGFLANLGKSAPIGRAARPEEIAELVAFLASDRTSFIVGSVVMADGGMSAACKKSVTRSAARFDMWRPAL